MGQNWKAEEECLAPPASRGLVRVFSLSISAARFPSDLRVGVMGLSVADTQLQQWTSEDTNSAAILKHLR